MKKSVPIRDYSTGLTGKKQVFLEYLEKPWTAALVPELKGRPMLVVAEEPPLGGEVALDLRDIAAYIKEHHSDLLK